MSTDKVPTEEEQAVPPVAKATEVETPTASPPTTPVRDSLKRRWFTRQSLWEYFRFGPDGMVNRIELDLATRRVAAGHDPKLHFIGGRASARQWFLVQAGWFCVLSVLAQVPDPLVCLAYLFAQFIVAGVVALDFRRDRVWPIFWGLVFALVALGGTLWALGHVKTVWDGIVTVLTYEGWNFGVMGILFLTLIYQFWFTFGAFRAWRNYYYRQVGNQLDRIEIQHDNVIASDHPKVSKSEPDLFERRMSDLVTLQVKTRDGTLVDIITEVPHGAEIAELLQETFSASQVRNPT